MGPFLLHRTSRLDTGGESCCPSLSHTESTHAQTTSQHNTTSYHYHHTHHHLGQHQSTGVQPTGRITSHHISRHKRRSGCTILRVHATPRTDGRTPRRFPILRFKRSRFTDCISSGRDRTERRNKSLSLVLYLLQNTPYALSISVIFDFLTSHGSFLGRFGIGARNRLLRRSARFGRYKVTFRIHSFLSLN